MRSSEWTDWITLNWNQRSTSIKIALRHQTTRLDDLLLDPLKHACPSWRNTDHLVLKCIVKYWCLPWKAHEMQNVPLWVQHEIPGSSQGMPTSCTWIRTCSTQQIWQIWFHVAALKVFHPSLAASLGLPAPIAYNKGATSGFAIVGTWEPSYMIKTC